MMVIDLTCVYLMHAYFVAVVDDVPPSYHAVAADVVVYFLDVVMYAIH